MNFETNYKERSEELAMFEALEQFNKPPAVEKDPALQAEQTEEAMYEAIENNSVVNVRAIAMSAVLSWAEYGEPTSEDFDITAQAMADVDEDGEVSEEEEESYNAILFSMAQALIYLDVSADLVEKLIDGDDKAASTIYVAVSEKIENSDISEDEIIAEFSVQEQGMTEAKVKVIRNGETKWIKKPLKKRRMSAAQRGALKKARMKANTAGARAKRKKSMRKRKSAGM
jgi:hypothetical protein